jgi:hypothetical protein
MDDFVILSNLSEDDQAKEIFAHFGLAAYNSQCLERGLAILLTTVYRDQKHQITQKQYDDLLSSNFRKTLGALVSDLRRKTYVAPTLLTDLEETLELRNQIIHRFFWDHAVDFTQLEGRSRMLTQLQQATSKFDQMNSKLNEIVMDWANKYGIDEEFLLLYTHEFLDGT